MVTLAAFTLFRCSADLPKPALEGDWTDTRTSLGPSDVGVVLVANADEVGEAWEIAPDRDAARLVWDIPALHPSTDTIIAVADRTIVTRAGGGSWTCASTGCSVLGGPDDLRALGRAGDDAVAMGPDGALYRLGELDTTWGPLPAGDGVQPGAVTLSAPAGDGSLLISDGAGIWRVRDTVEPVVTPCLYPSRCDATVVTALAGADDGTVWAEASGEGHLWTQSPDGTLEHALRVPVPGSEPAVSLPDLEAIAWSAEGLWAAGLVDGRSVLLRVEDRTVEQAGTWRWTLLSSSTSGGLLGVAQDRFAADTRVFWFQ